MANYLANRISKRRFSTARKKSSKAQNPKYIIGFDSEADTSSAGKPMLFQFSLHDQAEDDVVLKVVPETKHAGLGIFLDFLDEYCTSRSKEYLIYGWNLTYELTQLLHDFPKEVKAMSEFNITNIRRGDIRYKWNVEVFNGKRQMVVFRKSKNIKVTFLDGTAFYKISLDAAAKMLGVGEKYEASGIDRQTFTREDLDDPDFLRYARRDAYITRRIGDYIQAQHWQYQVPTTVSAPHFAATVFKTQFLKKDDGIGTPSTDIEQAGLYSYHGGKNGFYLDGPAEYATIYNYDITSAYPEAMKQLPDIEDHEWVPTKKYVPNKHALYKVTMDYSSCLYEPLQNHDGSKTMPSIVDEHWVTGYELDEIVNRDEGRIINVSGFLLNGKPGGSLSEFVNRFFDIKRRTTGPERETAKLLLNSLYGKFFQKQPLGSVGSFNLDDLQWSRTDPGNDYDYEAGGLYNPPIASLITGYVRAKIHRLEHKYESVMTSTDGFFGINPPDANDIGNGLGELTVARGHLSLWRERLYVFDGEDGKRKFALHGFHGGLKDLLDIPLARGEYTYYGKQMITLKMSTKVFRNKQYEPGQFVMMPYVIRI